MRKMIDPVSFLQEMVRVYSPTGQEGELAGLLVSRMQELGLRAYLDEVGNAVGELGEGRRTLMLLGHMDTVSGYIPVRLEEGRLYGRGAVDAKGPLAAFIMAAARQGPPADCRLIIVGAVEEEGCSRGAHHLVPRYRPDAVIIGEPSGWEHITLGYKGTLSVHYRLRRPRGHTAGQGETPAECAVAFWNAVVGYASAWNAGKERQFDMLTPTLVSICTESDGFQEQVEMYINLRWPLGVDIEEVRAWMEERAAPAELTFGTCEPPYRADKNTPLVRAFLQGIRAVGGTPRFKLKTGTSDMNVVGPAWGCPIAAYGPGDSNLDHTPEEHILIEDYLRAIAVLEQVLARW
jgi:LysW-gamma-L-lysine carboxypeptidase